MSPFAKLCALYLLGIAVGFAAWCLPWYCSFSLGLFAGWFIAHVETLLA